MADLNPREFGGKYWVQVGYTTSRPVNPDEHHSLIVTHAHNDTDAHLQAAQWVASKPRVQMPTSTKILKYEA